MLQFTYEVKDAMGLHARPAGMVTRKARTFTDSNIRIYKGEAEADLKQLLSVMGLSVKQGDEIRIAIEGGDEAAAAAELRTFIEANI